MLYELSDVRQIAGEGFRRWFRDDDFDLIVWYDDDGAIAGFQLCYGKQDYERALTWRQGDLYAHHGVDDGDGVRPMKGTPILVADGVFAKDMVRPAFEKAALKLDPDLARFVAERLDHAPSA